MTRALPFYQVDAFTVGDQRFTGNPAAVMPLDGPALRDDQLLAIAAENNLSETAFTWPCAAAAEADFELRWFTPTTEVALCGHATLAAAHVLIGEREAIRFRTRKAGVLTVTRRGDRLTLDLPLAPAAPTERADEVRAALRAPEAEVVLRAGPEPLFIAALEDEQAVRALAPDFAALRAIPGLVMVTAPGAAPDLDFVSRVFASAYGIDEDPVTGSAHAGLAPYWAERLGKTSLSAHQASARGGALACTLDGERLRLGGRALTVIEGRFLL
ncbi:PhzF family phenazine biosynthesis protein [Sphingomicrobium astaxanthinifaciens]|uniref:PhzF family phenazine biosynthesis protein n=1 Tax=Sphingomicrobium astaxanthinifaciens TaxID=1227949 RepID=UPI001FCC6001|nr:PhzF family phenazine biosynthesis protein [Sphingomicrobium astaxanthinifaciens]MCJ7420830.1 PhzF family phenazine biosynthesis protein [Sphingomicrobium astaxanthinifaciens]